MFQEGSHNVMDDKIFYINFEYMTRVYPYEASDRVKNFGVLEQYRDKMYTLREMNEIIADLIIRTPYIRNAMSLKISVTRGTSYHHILNIMNYEYDDQVRSDDERIEFLYN